MREPTAYTPRHIWIFSLLMTIVGWIVMMAYAIPEYLNLEIVDGRSSSHGRTKLEAFVSPRFARQSSGIGPLPAHEKVLWDKFAITVAGIVAPPSDWTDIDVWIVQPNFYTE